MNGEIFRKLKTMSAEDRRTFDRWLKANAIIGLIFAVGLIAMAVAGSNSGIKIPATDYAIVLETGERRPTPALLAAIERWLSTQFDLPAVQSHPRIELVAPKEIVALRYRGLLPNGGTDDAPNSRSAISSESDTVAVYDDSAQTIYLPQGWKGSTAAELSILVHEMVHHIQHLAGLKHECPQEREKLAYMAQDRWLNLFGHSLAQDFDLDGFSLLVKTKCFF